MRGWSPGAWIAVVGWALIVAVAIGVPTDLLPNPIFQRKIRAQGWTYPAWILSAGLIGLVVVALQRARTGMGNARGRIWGGGLLSLFAVGCPTCNQVVVALLGAGRALSFFAPLRPVISLASFALLAAALHRALQPDACALPGGRGAATSVSASSGQRP